MSEINVGQRVRVPWNFGYAEGVISDVIERGGTTRARVAVEVPDTGDIEEIEYAEDAVEIV
jgi:hypothetical protein